MSEYEVIMRNLYEWALQLAAWADEAFKWLILPNSQLGVAPIDFVIGIAIASIIINILRGVVGE